MRSRAFNCLRQLLLPIGEQSFDLSAGEPKLSPILRTFAGPFAIAKIGTRNVRNTAHEEPLRKRKERRQSVILPNVLVPQQRFLV